MVLAFVDHKPLVPQDKAKIIKKYQNQLIRSKRVWHSPKITSRSSSSTLEKKGSPQSRAWEPKKCKGGVLDSQECYSGD